MRKKSTGISVEFSTELENRSQIKIRFINGLEVFTVDTALLFLVWGAAGHHWNGSGCFLAIVRVSPAAAGLLFRCFCRFLPLLSLTWTPATAPYLMYIVSLSKQCCSRRHQSMIQSKMKLFKHAPPPLKTIGLGGAGWRDWSKGRT